jgi:hypothetical protein
LSRISSAPSGGVVNECPIATRESVRPTISKGATCEEIRPTDGLRIKLMLRPSNGTGSNGKGSHWRSLWEGLMVRTIPLLVPSPELGARCPVACRTGPTDGRKAFCVSAQDQGSGGHGGGIRRAKELGSGEASWRPIREESKTDGSAPVFWRSLRSSCYCVEPRMKGRPRRLACRMH